MLNCGVRVSVLIPVLDTPYIRIDLVDIILKHENDINKLHMEKITRESAAVSVAGGDYPQTRSYLGMWGLDPDLLLFSSV